MTFCERSGGGGKNSGDAAIKFSKQEERGQFSDPPSPIHAHS